MPTNTTQYVVLFDSTNSKSGDSNGTSIIVGGTAGSPFYSGPFRFDFSKYASIQYRAHSPSAGVINLQMNIEMSSDDGGYFSLRDSGVAVTYLAASFPTSKFALDSNNASPMFTISTAGGYVDNTWTLAQLNLPPAIFARLAVTKVAGNAADVTLDVRVMENDS